MIPNPYIDDADLLLYLTHSLSEPETAAVTEELSRSAELRVRLERVKACLTAYAESIDLTPVPEGGLDRFMSRVAMETRPKTEHRDVLSFPDRSSGPSLSKKSRVGTLLPWLGWAAAAGLAVTAGEFHHQRQSVSQAVAVQVPIPQQPSIPTALIQERDTLKANVAEQRRQIELLTEDGTKKTKEAESLRASLAGQAIRLKGETAQVAAAQSEQEALRVTMTAQADRVAQLTSNAESAGHIMDALTDPSALRVTLTKPKSHPAPTGRATYVANRGTLVFLASNMAALKADKVYQLWLMPADGSSPVPAGTFVPDARGNASVVYAQFSHPVPAKGFAVTVENTGGAQTPTLPILLAGATGV